MLVAFKNRYKYNHTKESQEKSAQITYQMVANADMHPSAFQTKEKRISTLLILPANPTEIALTPCSITFFLQHLSCHNRSAEISSRSPSLKEPTF